MPGRSVNSRRGTAGKEPAKSRKIAKDFWEDWKYPFYFRELNVEMEGTFAPVQEAEWAEKAGICHALRKKYQSSFRWKIKSAPERESELT